MNSAAECITCISNSFDNIVSECRSVLGSELHYQAMIYYILRSVGQVPVSQMGMNVKTTIKNPKNDFLKFRIQNKNIKFQSDGIEIIPDLTIFGRAINSDWRRRNYKNTLKETLFALEIKASERHKGRISFKEIETDILKLKAQYEETLINCRRKIGIGILIIDVAPDVNERIKTSTLKRIIELSKSNSVNLWYFNQDEKIEVITNNILI